jgi:hypothetical protein
MQRHFPRICKIYDKWGTQQAFSQAEGAPLNKVSVLWLVHGSQAASTLLANTTGFEACRISTVVMQQAVGALIENTSGKSAGCPFMPDDRQLGALLENRLFSSSRLAVNTQGSRRIVKKYSKPCWKAAL